ncbi:MAG: alpha/beta hydrolase [Dehalococcoidia bacterium]
MSGTPLNGGDLAGDLELSILGVAAREREGGSFDVLINSTRGEISAVLHPCEGKSAAVICVGGAQGGFDGPAGGLYPRLGAALASPDALDGMSSLRLHYRQPGEFEECVLDVLGGVSFLKGLGAQRVALVGHSFGAAVVIKAGELSDLVTGVAALSPQLYGTRTVERLSPTALLLVHGTADVVLNCAASQDIYDRAQEPRRLVLYAGADHTLMQCRDELFELLREWLSEVLAEKT